MGEFRYFIGLDLGQANEFTALAVLKRPMVERYATRHQRRPAYELGFLKRFPMGTPYPEIFAEFRTLLQSPPMPGAFVVVDQTGVGKAVVSMLQESLFLEE
jgi:hypothetical protein